jgi:DNA mismatch repair protein MutL
VEILSGGKRLIKVPDNGTGMDREDALLAFERHATSKIKTFDDLFDIRSLGFRGEALPSIASVSQVKLVTGLKGSSSGISVEIDGGTVKEIRDSPLAGTIFEIRDLFFNTPARKNFSRQPVLNFSTSSIPSPGSPVAPSHRVHLVTTITKP